MQSNTEDKNGIQYDAPARPDAKRCLDVLVVELRRAKGRDGWHRVCGREAVRDEMYGQKAECGRIAGHGDRASEWARNTLGENTIDDRAGSVYEQRPE
jgi:hypothetical protein